MTPLSLILTATASILKTRKTALILILTITALPKKSTGQARTASFVLTLTATALLTTAESCLATTHCSQTAQKPKTALKPWHSMTATATALLTRMTKFSTVSAFGWIPTAAEQAARVSSKLSRSLAFQE